MKLPKPQHKYPLPGRLRKRWSSQKWRRKARLQEMAKMSELPRYRDLEHLEDIAEFAFGFDLTAHLKKIMQEYKTQKWWRRRRFSVLEIGCGWGIALREIKQALYGKAVTYGIDIRSKKYLRRGHVDHYIEGDALTVQFPKADMIFSVVTLGYVGHPHVIVEKVADALNPNGIAILNFNRTGVDKIEKKDVPLLNGSEPYFEKLKERATTRTPGTRVEVRKGFMQSSTSLHEKYNDWFVLIRKGPAPPKRL